MKTYLEKIDLLKKIFSVCKTKDETYQKIMELGRAQPPLDAAYKIQDNIVKGCQSTMYLRSSWSEGSVIFQTESDALISSGLAALLVLIYSGENPEIILKSPPDYLEELGIASSLTPSRSNGLYSIHLRMKQEALKWLMITSGHIKTSDTPAK